MPVNAYRIAIIRRTWYAPSLAALRTRVVSFTELEGSRHSVEVVADSMFEAAALALKASRARDGLLGREDGDTSRQSISSRCATDQRGFL
jgi:hypothetical protein